VSMSDTGTWRYHVYDENNKEVKVSEYNYESEQAALADGAHYVTVRVPRDRFWHAMASHKSRPVDLGQRDDLSSPLTRSR
jgi:hypothetical protein